MYTIAFFGSVIDDIDQWNHFKCAVRKLSLNLHQGMVKYHNQSTAGSDVITLLVAQWSSYLKGNWLPYVAFTEQLLSLKSMAQ